MFVPPDDDKSRDKHVAAAEGSAFGRGFDSRRLHSTPRRSRRGMRESGQSCVRRRLNAAPACGLRRDVSFLPTHPSIPHDDPRPPSQHPARVAQLPRDLRAAPRRALPLLPLPHPPPWDAEDLAAGRARPRLRHPRADGHAAAQSARLAVPRRLEPVDRSGAQAPRCRAGGERRRSVERRARAARGGGHAARASCRRRSAPRSCSRTSSTSRSRRSPRRSAPPSAP